MTKNLSQTVACLVVALGLTASPEAARSSQIVLDNLAETPGGNSFSASIGQSFVTGTAATNLQSVVLQLDKAKSSATGLQLNLESRALDGTIGSTLFNDFSTAYDSATGLATFSAASSFVLAANTGYWLVASDTGSTDSNIYWVFTPSQNYASALGFSLPDSPCSWVSGLVGSNDASAYYTLAAGPQAFQITIGNLVASVPEPTSFVLCGIGGVAGLIGVRTRRRAA